MKPLSYAEFRKLDVNHIAHDAQRNNNVENLEVITRKANLQHAFTNPNRKSNAKALSKPILGKRKSEDIWTEFAGAKKAARLLTDQEGKTFSQGSITVVCQRTSITKVEFKYKTQPI